MLAQTSNDSLSPELQDALVKVKLMDLDGNGCDWDQWDGYPAERAAFLSCIAEHQIKNVVILSGDVHVGMAIEISRTLGEEPVAVEFVNSSFTSQNLGRQDGLEPAPGVAADSPPSTWNACPT